MDTERQSRNRTARSVWSAGYAPALVIGWYFKAGAYPALQTLRDIRRTPIASLLANMLDYCITEWEVEESPIANSRCADE